MVDEWDSNSENQLKDMGERAGGLRWMHDYQVRKWTIWGNSLTAWSLGLTTIGSAASLAFAQYDPFRSWVMYGVGTGGLVAALIQTARQYYNIDSQISLHKMIANRLGHLYRKIHFQLNTDKVRRQSLTHTMEWCVSEFDRINMESPSLDIQTIISFRNRFDEITSMATPDIASRDFTINIQD